MAEKAHATLGASSSERWIACPGSIRLGEGIPNTESSYAREGSCAHAVGEACLNQGRDALEFIDRTVDEYPDIEVTEEMTDAVQVYLDTVREDLKLDPDAEMFVEQKFDLTHIYPGMFGTNDCAIYFPKLAKLNIYDYKHGQGVMVDVEDNPQLKYYAVGALTGKHNRPIREIELIVVQPRAPGDNPVKRWKTNPVDLLDWIADLREAAKATEDPEAELNAGEWCKFCPAAAICPKLKEHVFDAARADFDTSGGVVVSAPQTYSPDALAQALKDAEVIKGWINSVQAFAHSEAEAGRIPPGFKLVPKRANRKWKDEKRMKDEMAEFGFKESDLLMPGKLMSPNQLETVLKKKGIDKKEIEPLWEKRSSGTNLAPLEDSRAAVKPAAETEFLTD